MTPEKLVNIRERTDQKLSYAEVHLNELLARNQPNGDVFDRAHQESFLYHLFGARDSFLQELNTYYKLGLPSNGVTTNNLKQKLKALGQKSKELTRLIENETAPNSWLSHAIAMRHHSTHMGGVPRVFFAGGIENGRVWLKNPVTGQPIEQDCYEVLALWHSQMVELIGELRASAIKSNGL